ncbi:MAG: sugar ABC transporter permease [Fidelibacterota bacterium]|nr:MAG: sugar ABC transporter permease [Candidatus Neomarinimicrobiota bacterium]UCH63811.1 MAG: sugar ABC transporter permease [Candidatus Neomarinimicrobiota bacterium]
MRRFRSFAAPYALIAPYGLHFLVIVAFPVVFSLILTFHQWNLLSPMKWIGGVNFLNLLSDPLFWKSLWNTFRFLVIHVPLQVGTALVLAEILNQRLRAKGFFRAVFFLPVVISGVVVTILWKQLYASESGIINTLLLSLGLGRVEWLTDPLIAMPAIAIMATWKNVGLYVILLLAGLQSIPRQVYEAATIDGASRLDQFLRITVPMLNPILLTVVILSTINGFSLFIEPYVMTAGGPLNSTLSMNLYIYRQAFAFYKMGYAATLGLVLAGMIFAVVAVQRRLIEKEF